MLNLYRDVFKYLEKHDVRYLVIGGIAAVIHGVPRATFDLDLLIETSHENAASLLKALAASGVSTADLTSPEDLLAHEITVFADYVRIDVQTWSPGLDFENAWLRHQQILVDEIPVHVVSRADLIASKRAAGRSIDLEDVRSLEGKPNTAP